MCFSPFAAAYTMYIIILHTRTPLLCVKKPTPVLHAVLQVYHFYTSHAAHRTRPATSAVRSNFPPADRRGGLRISKRILPSSCNKRTHTHIIGIILLLIFRCIIHTHTYTVERCWDVHSNRRTGEGIINT